ncbi:MAG: hypothetical protein WAX69_22685 [Victivallales bacterium]
MFTFPKHILETTAVVSLCLVTASCYSPIACRDGQVINLSREAESFEELTGKLAAGNTIATVIVDEPIKLMKDAVVPSSVTLKFYPGNMISLNQFALQVNGGIEAGPHQIFDMGNVEFQQVAKDNIKSKVTGNARVEGLYPQWWGARDDASQDASVAFQAAINYAKQSQYSRTVMVRGEFVVQNSLNVTKTKGIKFIGGEGKNQYNTVYAHTGDVLFDGTGSSHLGFRGFYIKFNPKRVGGNTPSNCAILLASSTEKGYAECLYNEIAYMYVELYRPDFNGQFGTVGVCSIGSEENTILSNQFFCDTPIILTAYSGIIKDEIKSNYTPVNTAHSCGVNTFSGENMLVAWNQRSYNMILNGVNTVSLGNIYFGGPTWPGTTGGNLSAIQLNSNVDILTGNIKMEGRTSVFDIMPGTVLSCVDIRTELDGAGNNGNKDYAVVNIRGARADVKLNSFNLFVTYPSFPQNKKICKNIFKMEKSMNPESRVEFNNSRIVSNQTSTDMTEALPPEMAGVAKNVEMAFRDRTYSCTPVESKK